MADVLVIDDDGAIRKLLALQLRSEHVVTATTNGRDAVDRIAAGERFDAVICDMNMPGMSGLDVHAAVARFDLEQARRIIFVTAGVRSAEEAARLATLPNRCFTKPFKVAELCEVVDGFLPIKMRGR